MDFDYKIIRSARKTVAIQINLSGEVIIRAPLKLSESRIDEMIAEKEQWILNAIERQRVKSESRKEYSEQEIKKLRRRAKDILPGKVAYYADIMSVKPGRISITSAKTRYGSCSSQNNLNFSLFLMDKNEAFIDYVVVHELAHIKHHNHSKDFYAFVESVMPDYKKIEKMYK